ncbi:MAG: hypothetical protein KDJ62_14070 [Rhodobiaceae bacterium]|nr:hypothetical protein [Rhodobiaceae bacterium]MCC0048116.1 hypothetical protein [Rhodobiaceae bacterium]
MAFVQRLKSYIDRKYKRIIAVMAVVVITLIASNIFTFNYFWQWEIDHADTEYQRRRLQIEGMGTRDADIVFAGDSFIEEGFWSFWFPDTDIINVGARGTTSYHMFWRRHHITRSHPAKVFMMLGINDLNFSDLILDIDELEETYASLLDKLAAEAPQTKIYVHAILPTGEPWPRLFDVETLRPINEFLAEQAKKHGYTFIDLTGDFANEDGYLDARYTYDGLHLNAEAYQVWVKRIRPYVEGQ